MLEHCFEAFVHHAAQMDVRKSVADPRFDATVNLLGLLNLMEAGRRAGLKKVVFASTGGAIYGEPNMRRRMNIMLQGRFLHMASPNCVRNDTLIIIGISMAYPLSHSATGTYTDQDRIHMGKPVS